MSGSTGFIGSALTAALLADGVHVTALSTGASAPDPSVTVLSWDPARGILDRGMLRRSGPFDAVVHLAGAGIGDRRWTAARKRTVVESRTRSTALLAAALVELDTPPDVVVSGSAVGYYGDRGDEVLTERSAVGAGYLADVCAAWESASAPLRRGGVRTVLLRSGIVMSPRGGALRRQLPLFRLGLGGRLGHGHQYRSWISLDDEVAVIRRCIEDTRIGGPVNATAPEPVTDATFARALATALHRPAALHVPAFALRLALGTELADEMLLAGQRAVPDVLISHGFTFAHPEIGGALHAMLPTARRVGRPRPSE